MGHRRAHYDSYIAWCREQGLPELLTYPGMGVTFSGHKVRDGCVFVGKRKRPIGRALVIHRAGGYDDIVISTKRERPLADVEATRWRLLERQTELLQQQLSLADLLRKAVKASKTQKIIAWCDRTRRLYDVEFDPSLGMNWVRVEEAQTTNMTPLTSLAAHATDPEIDNILSQFLAVQARLRTSWMRVGRINRLLADLIEQLTRKQCGYDPNAVSGVFFSINGRRYPAALSHHTSPGGSRHLWPSPTDRVVDSAEYDNVSLL